MKEKQKVFVLIGFYPPDFAYEAEYLTNIEGVFSTKKRLNNYMKENDFDKENSMWEEVEIDRKPREYKAIKLNANE